MLLEAATWRSGTADQHVSTLAPAIGVPVAVWIVDGSASVAIAQAHVSRANYLYAQNKVGVRFIATFTDVSSDPNSSVILDGIAPTAAGDDFECKDMASLRQSAFYRQNTLNVYYVKLAPTSTGQAFTGRNCAIRGTPADCNNLQPDPDGDGNVTFINSDANRAVLAHEFGHAFGLRPGPCGGHTNRLSGFAPDNIMWAGGDGDRARFTLGQVFRMNTQADQWGGTMLIKNGLRPGPGRPCPPLASNAQCPSLLIDWTRP
jgi:hypothetical protein